MRLLALIVCVLCFGVVPTTVEARTQTRGQHDHWRHHRHRHHRHHARAAKRSDPVAAALALAVRYWGAVPCSGRVTVVVGSPPANDENGGQGASMWASWDVGTPFENDETAPLPFIDCTLGINVAVWHSAYFEGYTAWEEFSIDVIHEYGHLLGHEHSTNPVDVMYPEPSANASVTHEFAPGWR